MHTDIQIDGQRFLINNQPTYPGVTYHGRTVEGLLFNSRMVQAIFDDRNPATARLWAYPDTGVWDPERNVDEFCAALPEYRKHGLLAVTVGLQGGGSAYLSQVYGGYENSAYERDGTFRPAYFERLTKVLEAADQAGMVVIVNYFYVAHARKMDSQAVIHRVTEQVSDWLLRTGYRNLLVDVVNESAGWWINPDFLPENVHKLIEIAQSVTLDGRRLQVGISTAGGSDLPVGRWREIEDLHLPHGNGTLPAELTAKLRLLKESDRAQGRPRPILINEDTVYLDNLEAAVAEYASWGFYHQGYGSGYQDRTDWTVRPRETNYADLTGFQTLPVNWGINDPWKKAFFDKLAVITGGTEP